MSRPRRSPLPVPHNPDLTGIEAMASRMAAAVERLFPDIRNWHPVDCLSAIAADPRVRTADRVAASRALLPLVTVATRPADVQINVAQQTKIVFADSEDE